MPMMRSTEHHGCGLCSIISGGGGGVGGAGCKVR
jgi:hypothetical protein